jgi:hypothetical protein
MGAKNGKRMKGTDGLSGLPENPGHCIQDLVRCSTKKGNTRTKPWKNKAGLERIYYSGWAERGTGMIAGIA